MDSENGEKRNIGGRILQDELREALARISSDTENGWVFERPVNLEKFPDYVDVIERPMHFSQMRVKINSNQYSSLEEFQSDFDLVVGNCLKYFAEDTMFYKAALKLKDEGRVIIKEVSDRIDIGNCIEKVLSDARLTQPSPSSASASISALENSSHSVNRPTDEATDSTEISLREELAKLKQKLEAANSRFSEANAMKLPLHSPIRKAIKAEKMSLRNKILHIERRLKQDNVNAPRRRKTKDGTDGGVPVTTDDGGDESENESPHASSKPETPEETVPRTPRNEFSWEQDFVAEVCKRPALWDRRIADYKLLPLRRTLWREVGAMFQLMDAREKWNLILNKFRGIHKRIQLQFPSIHDFSSASEERLDYLMHSLNGHRPWPLYKKMGFMLPFLPTFKNLGVNGEGADAEQIDTPSNAGSPSQAVRLWDKGNEHTDGPLHKFRKRGQVEGEQSHTEQKRLRHHDDHSSEVLDVHVSNDDVYGTFGIHVGDLASCVPQHLLPQCMRFVTSITYSFMNSKVPTVTFP